MLFLTGILTRKRSPQSEETGLLGLTDCVNHQINVKSTQEAILPNEKKSVLSECPPPASLHGANDGTGRYPHGEIDNVVSNEGFENPRCIPIRHTERSLESAKDHKQNEGYLEYENWNPVAKKIALNIQCYACRYSRKRFAGGCKG